MAARAKPQESSRSSGAIHQSDTRAITPRTRAERQQGAEAPPVSIDRFELLDLLGSGGMGRVYRAYDREMQREVALKTLHHLDADEVLRLKSEFRSLLGLKHRNLVDLYELFVDGDNCFFTLELIAGTSLQEHLNRGLGADTLSSLDAYGLLSRLRPIVEQLCEGLAVLHSNGKLHRDLKPSNLMITEEGRLVILDFGLSTHWGAEASRFEPDELVGTLPYMSPEQCWGKSLTPATDWYSLGVLLYELVTGQLPFAGSRFEVLQKKEQRKALPPKALCTGLPARVDQALFDLLNPDPLRRADGARLLQALESEGAPRGAVHHWVAPFLGRSEERSWLMRALEQAEHDGPVLVTVRGESGIGKTELLRRFTNEMDKRGLLVLRSRCHPLESVPYKALDGLIDGLSRFLEAWDPEEVEDVLPDHAQALAELFPVLARIPHVPLQEDDARADPRERRRTGFSSLSELFGRIAATTPIVMWIDDAQWADADSFLLLRELLETPARCPLLLLVSSRNVEVNENPLLWSLDQLKKKGPAERYRDLSMQPLGRETALAILEQLLGADCPPGVREQLVDEAAGYPFFLAELSRHVELTKGTTARQPLSVFEVLRTRLAALQASSRELLSIVSVAGGPLERSVALRAAGLGEAGRPTASQLEANNLLRFVEMAGVTAVETYHERIRETLLGMLNEDQLRTLHRKLADSLEEAPHPDPEALLLHHAGAGNQEAARHWAIRSAERAERTLAFDRAAQLYQRALELVPTGPFDVTLWERLGQSQVNTGRALDAARSFEQAARRCEEQAEDSPTVFRLKLKAAEQYLRSGHNDHGTRLMRTCLEQVSVPFPKSPAHATRASTWRRLRLLVSGTAPRSTAPNQAQKNDAAEWAQMARFDALWAATAAFSMMTPAYSDCFGVLHLVEALRHGESSRIVRSLAYEAVCEASVGGRWLHRRSERLIARAEALATSSNDPYDAAWIDLAKGSGAWCIGQWKQAARYCDLGSARFRKECRGVAWELATVELFGVSARGLMGDLAVLNERLPRLLQEAVDREDTFAANNYRLGQHSVLWLAKDQPEYLLDECGKAEASWPREGFHVQWYTHLLATCQALLYQDREEEAHRLLEERWSTLERGQLFQLQVPRIEMLHLRSRIELAKAARNHAHASEAQRTVLRDARKLKREFTPFAWVLGSLLEAGAKALNGQPCSSERLLELANELDQHDMSLHARACRFLAGQAHGLDELGVAEPERLVRMLVPGVR